MEAGRKDEVDSTPSNPVLQARKGIHTQRQTHTLPPNGLKNRFMQHVIIVPDKRTETCFSFI
jgi:hypothetical protein